jgi:hypothetical protein
MELRLRTLPVECLVVYRAGPRALAANQGESAGIACHRLTGFACINIASSLAGDHNVARVNSIMGPVVCIHPYVLYNC